MPLMSAEDFLNICLRPTLQEMDKHSPEAEKLLLMIACHESGGFEYMEQVGGPALSFYQIEPATFDDLYYRYLERRQDLKALLTPYEKPGLEPIDNLIEPDQTFATASARLILWQVPDPIPAVEDEAALSEYAKEYWNTGSGKATAQKYLDDYNHYKPAGYGE